MRVFRQIGRDAEGDRRVLRAPTRLPQYVPRARNVTEAEVKKSAATHLKPAPAVFLVVGDGDAKMMVYEPAQPKRTCFIPAQVAPDSSRLLGS